MKFLLRLHVGKARMLDAGYLRGYWCSGLSETNMRGFLFGLIVKSRPAISKLVQAMIPNRFSDQWPLGTGANTKPINQAITGMEITKHTPIPTCLNRFHFFFLTSLNT